MKKNESKKIGKETKIDSTEKENDQKKKEYQKQTESNEKKK